MHRVYLYQSNLSLSNILLTLPTRLIIYVSCWKRLNWVRPCLFCSLLGLACLYVGLPVMALSGTLFWTNPQASLHRSSSFLTSHSPRLKRVSAPSLLLCSRFVSHRLSWSAHFLCLALKHWSCVFMTSLFKCTCTFPLLVVKCCVSTYISLCGYTERRQQQNQQSIKHLLTLLHFLKRWIRNHQSQC